MIPGAPGCARGAWQGCHCPGMAVMAQELTEIGTDICSVPSGPELGFRRGSMITVYRSLRGSLLSITSAAVGLAILGP